jgi:hypothetical protein
MQRLEGLCWHFAIIKAFLLKLAGFQQDAALRSKAAF